MIILIRSRMTDILGKHILTGKELIRFFIQDGDRAVFKRTIIRLKIETKIAVILRQNVT